MVVVDRAGLAATVERVDSGTAGVDEATLRLGEAGRCGAGGGATSGTGGGAGTGVTLLAVSAIDHDTPLGGGGGGVGGTGRDMLHH